MRNHPTTIAAAALALAVGGAAAAKDVDYDFIACTHGQTTMLEANGEIKAYRTESWGTVASSSTGKEFEKASTHCMGYTRVLGGKPYAKGLCKWVFASGDTGVGEYEYGAAPAKFTWLAGTGGLKGIQGGGTFAPVFDAKPAQEGTGQGCRRDWGSYQIPG